MCVDVVVVALSVCFGADTCHIVAMLEAKGTNLAGTSTFGNAARITFPSPSQDVSVAWLCAAAAFGCCGIPADIHVSLPFLRPVQRMYRRRAKVENAQVRVMEQRKRDLKQRCVAVFRLRAAAPCDFGLLPGMVAVRSYKDTFFAQTLDRRAAKAEKRRVRRAALPAARPAWSVSVATLPTSDGAAASAPASGRLHASARPRSAAPSSARTSGTWTTSSSSFSYRSGTPASTGRTSASGSTMSSLLSPVAAQNRAEQQRASMEEVQALMRTYMEETSRLEAAHSRFAALRKDLDSLRRRGSTRR